MSVRITSRYNGAPVYEAADADGDVHPTVAIRQSTPPVPGTTMYQHRVSSLENLEYLAWRYYGSSEAWWRIAEANRLVFPLDLAPGDTLSIPALDDLGRVVRTRRF